MTDDLSQCKNCIYHYIYNGKDMCKQVGDDFYLQWKVEDCPHHTTITSATKISDEIYRLRAENAALRERLERAIELPVKIGDKVFCIVGLEPAVEEFEVIAIELQRSNLPYTLFKFQGIDVGDKIMGWLSEYGKKWFTKPEEAEARMKELKEGKSEKNNISRKGCRN